MDKITCLLISLLVVVTASTLSVAAADVDVREFFTGVWEIEHSTDAIFGKGVSADGGEEEDLVVIESLQWNISAVPFSSVLRGTSVDVNERVTSILLDFPEVVLAADGTVAALSSSLKGSLLSSSPSFLFAAPRQLQHHEAADPEGLDESDDDFVEADDETETAAGDASNWTPIFSFDFQSFPANIHYSSGAYGATGTAHYQLLITDPKGFILNIIQQDASGKITNIHVIVGRKIVAPPEPGFFQKYSMFIMIGFMLLMQFIKARAQTGVGPEGEAEAPAAAGVAPAVGTASSTATRQRSGNSEVVHHKTQ